MPISLEERLCCHSNSLDWLFGLEWEEQTLIVKGGNLTLLLYTWIWWFVVKCTRCFDALFCRLGWESGFIQSDHQSWKSNLTIPKLEETLTHLNTMIFIFFLLRITFAVDIPRIFVCIYLWLSTEDMTEEKIMTYNSKSLYMVYTYFSLYYWTSSDWVKKKKKKRK